MGQDREGHEFYSFRIRCSEVSALAAEVLDARKRRSDASLNRQTSAVGRLILSLEIDLYTGITNSLYRRVLQHKSGEIDGFTKRYNIDRLVYYEIFHQVGNAIAREKQIKSWTRAKRLALIKTKNPTWQELAEGWGRKSNCRSLGAPDELVNSSGLARDDNVLGNVVNAASHLLRNRIRSIPEKAIARSEINIAIAM